MLKYLGVVLLGVVIGAATAEVMRQQKPELFEKINKQVKAGMDSVKAKIASAKAAFNEGYQATASAKAQ